MLIVKNVSKVVIGSAFELHVNNTTAENNTYYLLTGCKGRTRKYKPNVFHTALACESCLEIQGLVFPGTAQAPS